MERRLEHSPLLDGDGDERLLVNRQDWQLLVRARKGYVFPTLALLREHYETTGEIPSAGRLADQTATTIGTISRHLQILDQLGYLPDGRRKARTARATRSESGEPEPEPIYPLTRLASWWARHRPGP